MRFASHELAYLPNLAIPFNKFLHPISSVQNLPEVNTCVSYPAFSNPTADRVQLRFGIACFYTPFPTLFAATPHCRFHISFYILSSPQSSKTKQVSHGVQKKCRPRINASELTIATVLFVPNNCGDTRQRGCRANFARQLKNRHFE